MIYYGKKKDEQNLVFCIDIDKYLFISENEFEELKTKISEKIKENVEMKITILYASMQLEYFFCSKFLLIKIVEQHGRN